MSFEKASANWDERAAARLASGSRMLRTERGLANSTRSWNSVIRSFVLNGGWRLLFHHTATCWCVVGILGKADLALWLAPKSMTVSREGN